MRKRKRTSSSIGSTEGVVATTAVKLSTRGVAVDSVAINIVGIDTGAIAVAVAVVPVVVVAVGRAGCGRLN